MDTNKEQKDETGDHSSPEGQRKELGMRKQQEKVFGNLVHFNKLLERFTNEKKDKETVVRCSNSLSPSVESDCFCSLPLSKENCLELLDVTNKFQGQLIGVLNSFNEMEKAMRRESIVSLGCKSKEVAESQIALSNSNYLSTDILQLGRKQFIGFSGLKRTADVEVSTLEELGSKRHKEQGNVSDGRQQAEDMNVKSHREVGSHGITISDIGIVELEKHQLGQEQLNLPRKEGLQELTKEAVKKVMPDMEYWNRLNQHKEIKLFGHVFSPTQKTVVDSMASEQPNEETRLLTFEPENKTEEKTKEPECDVANEDVEELQSKNHASERPVKLVGCQPSKSEESGALEQLEARNQVTESCRDDDKEHQQSRKKRRGRPPKRKTNTTDEESSSQGTLTSKNMLLDQQRSKPQCCGGRLTRARSNIGAAEKAKAPLSSQQ